MVQFVDDRLNDGIQLRIIEDETPRIQAASDRDIDAVIVAMKATAFVSLWDLRQEMCGLE
jgi:hypothetical protein